MKFFQKTADYRPSSGLPPSRKAPARQDGVAGRSVPMPLRGELLNQQSGDLRNSGDVLKKTPATRGTRRGRLGILKLLVEFYG